MAKSRNNITSLDNVAMKPAETSEARENQIIAKAIDLVERQIDDGTVSAMVLSQYIKLGSEKAKLEREKLKAETELAKAKVEATKAEIRLEGLYKDAIEAMKIYTGNGDV